MEKYIDCVMAGVGGQGVMTIGELLAYAGIASGLNATSLPEYGTEVRGGNANCTVVLSSSEIGSPIIKHPRSLIAMSPSAVDMFQDKVADNGFTLVNSSLAEVRKEDRIAVYPVPMNDLAGEARLNKMVNMVAMGAYVSISRIVEMDQAIQALDKVIPERYMHLKDANIEALTIGAAYAKNNF